MKKGIFIVYDDLENPTGVNKKILSQISAFKEKGFEIVPYKMEAKVIPGYKIFYRLPFTNLSPEWNIDTKLLTCDFIYLRRPLFMNMYFLRFLKYIKKMSPYVKILMEIPTYPYDKEITKNKRNWPIFIKDVFARKKIRRYIDAIPLLTGEKRVFGIDTIRIKNGFDFNNSRVRRFDIDKETIDIAIVAQFDIWHGYDRIIDGLHQYYLNKGNREIILHFVGDGPELNSYKKMSSLYRLDNHIKFYGMQNKEFIEELYDKCDIGASTFGAYRINLNYTCTLKSREYLAAGLPLVCGGKMDIIEYPELQEYILEFPNDDSFISIESIIGFYDNMYKGKTEEEINDVINHIRDVAVKNLDMKQAMKNVFDYLNN